MDTPKHTCRCVERVVVGYCCIFVYHCDVYIGELRGMPTQIAMLIYNCIPLCYCVSFRNAPTEGGGGKNELVAS